MKCQNLRQLAIQVSWLCSPLPFLSGVPLSFVCRVLVLMHFVSTLHSFSLGLFPGRSCDWVDYRLLMSQTLPPPSEFIKSPFNVPDTRLGKLLPASAAVLRVVSCVSQWIPAEYLGVLYFLVHRMLLCCFSWFLCRNHYHALLVTAGVLLLPTCILRVVGTTYFCSKCMHGFLV